MQICFAELDRSSTSEWAALRRFFELWQECPIGSQPLTIPPQWTTTSSSIGELSHLLESLRASRRSDALRDDIKIAEVPGHDAIRFLWQCEGDFIWAIRCKDWSKDDPEVIGFVLDYDASETEFIPIGTVAQNLPAFLLEHSSHFVYRTHATGLVQAPNDREWLAEMRRAFPVTRHLQNVEVFEDSGIIAILYADPFEADTRYLSLNVKNSASMANCPDVCLKMMKNGGSFGGAFADR